MKCGKIITRRQTYPVHSSEDIYWNTGSKYCENIPYPDIQNGHDKITIKSCSIVHNESTGCGKKVDP